MFLLKQSLSFFNLATLPVSNKEGGQGSPQPSLRPVHLPTGAAVLPVVVFFINIPALPVVNFPVNAREKMGKSTLKRTKERQEKE